MLVQSPHETEMSEIPCSRSGLALLSSELSSRICSASNSLTVVLSLLSRLCTRRLCTRSRFHTAVPTSCTYLSISCKVNVSTFYHPPQSDWLKRLRHSLANRHSCPTPAKNEGRDIDKVGPTEIRYSIAWTNCGRYTNQQMIFVYL